MRPSRSCACVCVHIVICLVPPCCSRVMILDGPGFKYKDLGNCKFSLAGQGWDRGCVVCVCVA